MQDLKNGMEDRLPNDVNRIFLPLFYLKKRVFFTKKHS